MKKITKIILSLYTCLFVFSVYGIGSKNTEILLAFAEKNNLIYIDCLEGKFSDEPNKQLVGFFKDGMVDYKAFYFVLRDNLIIDHREINQFCHYFNTTAFDLQQLENNFKISHALGFVYDLNGDGYDELILDHGENEIFPLVLKYSDHGFKQILQIDKFPTSNVVLPGAPNIFEIWRLVFVEEGKIILKRYQSDLVQYVTFLWNNNHNCFSEPNNYDYFENTGFASSNFTDFKYLKTELTLEYLETLSSKQLRLLRNAIYAQYGRSFLSWDLADNFLQCKWYKVNTKFSDSALNQIDRKNIKLIQSFEQKKGIFKPVSWDLEFEK